MPVAALLTLAALALAPVPAPPPVPASAPGAEAPDDPAALEQFLDRTVIAALIVHDVPGAVVAVVRGDRVLLVKGYGLADLGSRRPMSGEGTVVRVGSLSKPVTASVVVDLIGRGLLDPDADVNMYLGRAK